MENDNKNKASAKAIRVEQTQTEEVLIDKQLCSPLSLSSLRDLRADNVNVVTIDRPLSK